MVRHLVDIPHEELQLLGAAAQALGLHEAVDLGLELQLTEGHRRWIGESPAAQLLVDIDTEPSGSSGVGIFRISQRICGFADAFGVDTVSLLIENDAALIAYASGASVVTDLERRSSPQFTPWSFVPVTSAIVDVHRIYMLLLLARRRPTDLRDTNYPLPPVWLELEDGTINLHVDWTDFVPSRATYRMRAISHQGDTRVSIPHELIESALRIAPEHHDNHRRTMSLAVGTVTNSGGERDALMLGVDGWRLVMVLVEPVTERWAAHVDEVLAAATVAVAHSDGVEWAMAGDHEVRVRLHHGHPDVARVTAVLLRNAEENVELFRELGELNAASNHIRYWLDDGVVRSAVDVQCTELRRLPDIVDQVSSAAAKYAPMLAVLSHSE